MAFKVQVGPAQIAIHQSQTVLVTKPDGQVTWPTTGGLYFRDTRVIDGYQTRSTAGYENMASNDSEGFGDVSR
jgi:hypothetical protein